MENQEKSKMDKVNCKVCPIQGVCESYKLAQREYKLLYNPQDVVRVWERDCPLAYLVKSLTDRGFPKTG